jgi:hypothetical protein
MRDRWQENRRASSAKDDVNSSRWRQLVKAMEVTGSKKQVISGNMEGKLVHMAVLLLEEACSLQRHHIDITFVILTMLVCHLSSTCW